MKSALESGIRHLTYSVLYIFYTFLAVKQQNSFATNAFKQLENLKEILRKNEDIQHNTDSQKQLNQFSKPEICHISCIIKSEYLLCLCQYTAKCCNHWLQTFMICVWHLLHVPWKYLQKIQKNLKLITAQIIFKHLIIFVLKILPWQFPKFSSKQLNYIQW